MALPVHGLIESLIPSQHRWKIILFKEWERIIGDLHDKVFIYALHQGVLVLGVCHPVWAQELSFVSDMLKAKINCILKEEKINAIRFKTIYRKKKKSPSQKERKPAFMPQNVKKVTLSAQEKVCLKQVKNDALRGALLVYYTRCAVRPKK